MIPRQCQGKERRCHVPRTRGDDLVWGTIYVNSKMSKAVSETPCSDGRHEVGHPIEAMLSKYDKKEFMSAKHSKRIITRALRNYNKRHTENTYSAEKLIYNTISSYPSAMASKYTGKNATEILYSEALAESIRVATEAEQIDTNSFLSFVIKSVLKEIK